MGFLWSQDVALPCKIVKGMAVGTKKIPLNHSENCTWLKGVKHLLKALAVDWVSRRLVVVPGF